MLEFIRQLNQQDLLIIYLCGFPIVAIIAGMCNALNINFSVQTPMEFLPVMLFWPILVPLLVASTLFLMIFAIVLVIGNASDERRKFKEDYKLYKRDKEGFEHYQKELKKLHLEKVSQHYQEEVKKLYLEKASLRDELAALKPTKEVRKKKEKSKKKSKEPKEET